jgi:transglutaminase-like putative cysteine protease
MSFLALHKLVTYAIAGLGLVALSFGGELPPLSLLFLALGYVASAFGEDYVRRTPRFAVWVMRTLLALLVVQVLRGFFSGALLSLAMELSGWLTISRLLQRQTGSDYQQVVMLAFVQLISATVLTSDLGFGVLFLGYVLVVPWALSLSHLRREIELAHPERTADVTRLLTSQRIVGSRFLGGMALLAVPTLLMTLSLFVFFPRIGLGFMGLGRKQPESVAGFGSNIELGGFGVIRDDPTIVLRVSAGQDLAPGERLRALRLRGTAFDQYDGRRWTRSSGRATRLSSVGDYYPLRRFPTSKDTTLRIALERIDEPVLFLPSAAVGFRIPFRGSPQRPYDQAVVTRGHGLDLRYLAREEQGLVYEVVVGQRSADGDVPEAHDLEGDLDYLGVPEGHDRVRALAESIRGDATDPLVIAERFQRHLRDEGRYVYSLEQPDTEDRLPLEVFLFEARRGHCEYFATAMAIMLRSVGIPSRNVTGFIGGEFNPFGNYYAIRQGDAHSWVEVLIAERGWVAFDPTPPSASAFAPSRSVLSPVHDVIDALRTYWAQRVVGYELRDQLQGARAMAGFFQKFSWFSAASSAEHGRPGALRSELALLLRGARTWWLALGGVVLALLGAAVVRRGVRRRERLPASTERVRRLYRRLLSELARRGLQRAPHVTPAQLRQLVALRDARAAEVVSDISEVFERVRYGAGTVSEGELRGLEQRLRELRRAA